MHHFKIGFNFVKHLNQPFILAVFNDEMSKVILFLNTNRFLSLMTQGSIGRDLIKKKYI